MAKSSIHIQPVKTSSEVHNLRKKDLDYVRKDLSGDNFSWVEKSIKESRRELEILVKEKTGRRMQKKATPIREGVFLISAEHSDKQVLDVIKGIESRFGIRPIQLHIHRDEGHYAKNGQWKPNLHAHVVFEWIDRKTGKSFKLDKNDMSELQTYFADSLGMERGRKSGKSHLNALEWKIQKKKEFVKKYDNVIVRSLVLSQLKEKYPKIAELAKKEQKKVLEFLHNPGKKQRKKGRGI